MPAAATSRPPPPPAPPGAAAAAAEAAWQVTFADLAALLLSFFVLVFAMSVMDEERWSALSASLVERQIPGDAVPAAPPVRPLAAPREPSSAGAASSDYLHALLRRRLDRAPLLVPAALERTPDAVLVRFAAGLILDGERPAPTAQGRLLLGQLVPMLAPLDNAVSLRLRPAATGPGWAGDDHRAGGLRAAAAAASVLRAAGFHRPLAVYALATAGSGPAAAAAAAAGGPTVEIVIHRETAGG